MLAVPGLEPGALQVPRITSRIFDQMSGLLLVRILAGGLYFWRAALASSSK
jgi:hypothetical protein